MRRWRRWSAGGWPPDEPCDGCEAPGGLPLAVTTGLGATVTAVGLAATLASARAGRRRLEILAKPAASAGFLVVALGAGALDSRYGAWILAGLVLSWCGDVVLLSHGAGAFRAGLAAFLLAHVAYGGAFVVAGVAVGWTAAAAAAAAGVAAVVLRWLWPHVGVGMRVPVLAYVVVIGAMLSLAVGTRGAGHTPLIVAGAVLFYLSDLFVARQRFVTPAFVNRLVGLPLYYAGQLLLALSVGA